MVKKKFPVIPVIIAVGAIGGIVYFNFRTHWTPPPPTPEAQTSGHDAPTAASVSQALKSSDHKPMPQPGQGSMEASGLVQSASQPIYTPKPTNSSIIGEWYSKESMKKFPSDKATQHKQPPKKAAPQAH